MRLASIQWKTPLNLRLGEPPNYSECSYFPSPLLVGATYSTLLSKRCRTALNSPVESQEIHAKLTVSLIPICGVIHTIPAPHVQPKNDSPLHPQKHVSHMEPSLTPSTPKSPGLDLFFATTRRTTGIASPGLLGSNGRPGTGDVLNMLSSLNRVGSLVHR